LRSANCRFVKTYNKNKKTYVKRNETI